MAQTTVTTCQICARPIKSTTGLIAHHGYTRPGGGWQTESCIGARRLPYELSCDALPGAIAMVETFIARQQAALDALLADPPVTLIHQPTRAGRPLGQQRTLVRPEGFDPRTYHGKPDSYGVVFTRRVNGLRTSVKHASVDLPFLRERLAAWVAPRAADPMAA